MRFSMDTAEWLSATLTDIAGPERLAEVGELDVRCETGPKFLARADPACAKVSRGET